MSNCEDWRQNYCCIVEGQFYCKVHCPRIQCYCIRCIIQTEIRQPESEVCQYCDKEPCCYYAINTGVFWGQNRFKISRLCPEHCNKEHCDCNTCKKDPEEKEQGTFLFAIPISHPTIIVRDGYPQAQAYVFHGDLDPQIAEDRESQLSQVSQTPGNSGMVSELSAQDRSCEGAIEADQGSGRTGGRGNRARRNRNATGRSRATTIPRVNTTNSAHHRGMQLRERNNGRRVPIGPPRNTNTGRTNPNGTLSDRWRGLRSRGPVDGAISNPRWT